MGTEVSSADPAGVVGLVACRNHEHRPFWVVESPSAPPASNVLCRHNTRVLVRVPHAEIRLGRAFATAIAAPPSVGCAQVHADTHYKSPYADAP